MGYWDDSKNVEDYVAMAHGYDGRLLIARLREDLPEGATVLELGMGPGVDLDLLAETYAVTGSDVSQVFLDRYREAHEDADLVLLDAVTVDTDRTFDAVYSNKVLHHLASDALQKSLARQWEVVRDGGLLMHSFWAGSGSEEHHGLLFTYHDEASLRPIIGDGFEVVDMQRYEEMAADDSIYVLLRKRGRRGRG